MTMIEKVAMAMWEERRHNARRDGIDLDLWGDGTVPRANGIIEEAIAAVRALREPTGKMFVAADEALVPVFDAQACWQAMIDSILADTE